MSKFYMIHAVPDYLDDFEVIGIFTRDDDAKKFVIEKENSGEFICVARPQLLEMKAIIDLLVNDRLRELAEPIKKLAKDIEAEE